MRTGTSFHCYIEIKIRWTSRATRRESLENINMFHFTLYNLKAAKASRSPPGSTITHLISFAGIWHIEYNSVDSCRHHWSRDACSTTCPPHTAHPAAISHVWCLSLGHRRGNLIRYACSSSRLSVSLFARVCAVHRMDECHFPGKSTQKCDASGVLNVGKAGWRCRLECECLYGVTIDILSAP